VTDPLCFLVALMFSDLILFVPSRAIICDSLGCIYVGSARTLKTKAQKFLVGWTILYFDFALLRI
jgi:hypothetical protein